MEGAIMDLITLNLAKKYANKIAAGVTAVRVEGSSIIFTLVDGTEAVCQLPIPKDGVSVQDLSIDKDGSLLCHMSDGNIIDAGYVPAIDPDLTNYYTKEEITALLFDYIVSGDLEDTLKNYATINQMQTRLATDLENINETGIERIKEIADYTEDDKTKVSIIKNDGEGNRYLSDDGTYKEVQGGASYTAGTNIEITEDNIINNTIPYKLNSTKTGLLIGNDTQNHSTGNKSLFVGLGVQTNANDIVKVTAIGNNARIIGESSTSLGNSTLASENSVAIGENAMASGLNSIVIGKDTASTHDCSIVLGNGAIATKDFQFMLGSEYAPIDEMNVFTGDGIKQIATTDDIQSALGNIETLLADIDTGNGV